MSDAQSTPLNKLENQEERAKFITLFVPYIDINADGNDQTARLEWELVGTNTVDNHKLIMARINENTPRDGVIDRETLDKLREEIQLKGTPINDITNSRDENAIKELAFWMQGIETELDAKQWLEKQNFPTDHYELSAQFTQKAGKKSNLADELNADHWEETSPHTFVRSALVQKYKSIRDLNDAAIEEINSDIVPAGDAAAGALLSNYSISGSSVALTVCGLVIAGIINIDKHHTQKDFHKILRVESKYRQALADGTPKKEAIKELKKDIKALGVILANTQPTTPEEFKKYSPTFHKLAKEKGYYVDPRTTITHIREQQESLSTLGKNHGASIAHNLGSALKTGSIASYDGLVRSVKRLRHPVALLHGSYNGMKALSINATAIFSSKHKKRLEQSDIAVQKFGTQIKIVSEHAKNLPKMQTLTTEKGVSIVKDAKQLHEAQITAAHNIEAMRSRRNVNGGVFIAASAVTGVSGVTLVQTATDLIQYYIMNPQSNEQLFNTLNAALNKNWIDMAVNSWGLLLGGLTALATTGQEFYNNTKAINSEFANVDTGLEKIHKYSHTLTSIINKQAENREKRKSTPDTQIHIGQSDSDYLVGEPSGENNTVNYDPDDYHLD